MPAKDNAKKWFRLIAGRISPFLLLFGLFADVSSLLPQFEILLKIVLFVSTFCIVAYTIWRIIESSKTRDLRSKIDILEREVCKGIKMISNEASVTMNVDSNKYQLEFVKEYEIISENSSWYSGQFYCNKILGSAEDAQEYHGKHKVSWEALSVQAHVQYKNPDDTDWSHQVEVYVKHVADGNNYKEFHVEYKTVSRKDQLDIKKGTRVKLAYTYEVPLDIWGTYLNRYITYWQEEATVTISCSDRQKLDDAVFKLYRTDEVRGPVLIENVEWSPSSKQQGSPLFSRKLIVPAKKVCCRYIVWWDAKRFFGDSVENTVIVADESHLTNQ